MIRVLIADDSLLVRQVLSDILERHEGIAIAGCARNGIEAVEMTLRLKPDLVIMDLVMPELDGLGAIEEIMAAAPTPVLVLSAAVESTEVDRAFTAIKRGALDVMEKPAADTAEALDCLSCRLVEKVRLLAGIRVIRHPRRKQRPLPTQPPVVSGPTPDLLAIGASTGGPKAVMALLRTLPADFPATVLVVQHIAEGFAQGFATWLDRECAIRVRLAGDGDSYGAGVALVAPDRCHMTVCDGRIRLSGEAAVNCCRPSIDVLFDSLAGSGCEKVVSVLLTGMGKDGARGLLKIKQRGGTTIVQDEMSCAVFGMPKAAIDLNAVDRVLPLEAIPSALSELFAPR